MAAPVPFGDNNRYRVPGTRAVLWRYVSLTWLIKSLQTGSLWVPRADQLGGIDVLEGGLSDAEVDRHTAWQQSENALAQMPAAPKYLADQMKGYAVSSWFMGPRESIAMWKLFAGEIAIRTTFGRLCSSLTPTNQYGYHYGRVRYATVRRSKAAAAPTAVPTPAPMELRELLMRKDQSLSHEKEFRLLLVRDDICKYGTFDSLGVSVRAEWSQLITHVVTSPTHKQWELEAIRTLLRPYLPHTLVHASVFSTQPPMARLRDSYVDPDAPNGTLGGRNLR